jgi:outer membrane lipase/esterase
LWTGGGDLRDAVNYAQAHPATALSDGEAVVSAAIANVPARGATTVLVPNVPDLGMTPETRDWATASVAWLPAYASTLSGNFNLRLDALIGSFTGLEIIPFDVNGVFGERRADPAAFGLQNVTDPCPAAGVASIYVGGAVCAGVETRLWWGNRHPTAAVYRILGERMLNAARPRALDCRHAAAGAGLAGRALSRGPHAIDCAAILPWPAGRPAAVCALPRTAQT